MANETSIQEYEEWQVEATKKWIVTDERLPASTREEAQRLCDLWNKVHPNTYKPVGFKVRRESIANEKPPAGAEG